MKGLRRLRGAKGITQAQLAKALRVSKSLIGQLEADWQRPYPKILKKLAKYFNCSEGDLL